MHCRNTLRVRLYQKLENEMKTMIPLFLSQYSASTIISKVREGLFPQEGFQVAILCEYDYIKSVPLETLVRQGFPGRYRRHVRKSVMPKDKVLTLLTVLTSILHKLNELYNIEGIFGCTTSVNVLIYNTIQFFLRFFRPRKKHGFDVFLLTVCFQRL